MTGRSRRQVVAALALAGLVGVACSTDPTDATDVPLPTIGLGSDTGEGPAPRPTLAVEADQVERIAMIGDSITVGATPFLEEQFADLGIDASIDAQVGKRIDVTGGSNLAGTRIAAGVAEQLDADGFDDESVLWVVALGTNDIGQYAARDEVDAAIDDLLAEIPGDAPLVWINTYFADRPEQTAMVNEAIDWAVVRRGNATVGRWYDVAPTDGVLRSDGVHPNDDGAEVFATLVTATVDDALTS